MENTLPFTNIRSVWPKVREGLYAILNDWPEVRWSLEDVYAACVNGEADLCYEDGRFIILKRYMDELTLRKVLWVWIAYGNGLILNQERLDAYARDQGFDEIRLTSPRLGWQKVKGWRFAEATYTREV